MNKTRGFYLFFELRKIIVIEAKLDEEQMGTARNQKGKNKENSWLCHRFTFDSDAFCVEMKKKAYAHRYDLGEVVPDV